jgi:hypothetical protein
MKKIYMVALRLVDTPLTIEKIALLDNVMSGLGDWYRFNGFTWLLDTQSGSKDIKARVRNVLGSNDSVIIGRLDLSDVDGWASPEIWNWLLSKASTNVLANAMGLGDTIGPGLGRNALAGHRSPFEKSDDKGK